MKKVFYNATIHAGSKHDEIYSAMYIKNGIIIALGTDEEILAAAEAEGAEKEDANKAHIFPGFVESHMHVLETAQHKHFVPLYEARSLNDVIKLCQAKLEWAKENNKWINGIMFNQDEWDVKEIPTRHDLDAVSKDIPVCIRRVCMHVSVCNTKAMEMMGLLENVPEDSHDFFDFYKDGTPNGIIRESAQYIIADSQPPLTKDELKDMIVSTCLEAASKGITEIQTDDFHISKDNGETIISAYRELAEEGKLPIRIYEQNYMRDEESLQAFLDKGHKTGETHGLFRIGPLKLILDGSLGSHSAYMLKPYLNDPETRGLPYHEKDEIYRMCKLAHDNGMQIATHCIGDAALADILEVYKKVQWENPRTDCRHGVVHCQIMSDAQTEEFKKLGIIGYIQPIFLKFDMNIVDDCVGAELGKQSYNWRKFASMGVHICGGSDSPVEAFDVMPNIQYAVTRTNPDTGKSWYPENSLTIEEAMRSFTYEGAYASFAENMRGIIEVGREADLVMLRDNPYTVAPETLKDIEILQTVVRGNTVFTA